MKRQGNSRLNQSRGQTLVEYVMLLSMLIGVLLALQYYVSTGFHEHLYNFYYELIILAPPSTE